MAGCGGFRKQQAIVMTRLCCFADLPLPLFKGRSSCSASTSEQEGRKKQIGKFGFSYIKVKSERTH
jgi:hypothetical protein